MATTTATRDGTVLLSPADAARMAQVSRDTIYREIERGELRARHVGRLLRIDPADFRAYLDRECTGTRPRHPVSFAQRHWGEGVVFFRRAPLDPAPVDISPSVRSLPDGIARCPRCERGLPVSEFARDRSKASGHKSHCKGCDREKSRRYYAANRERVLAKRAKRTAELREAGFQVRRGWSKWRAISRPEGALVD